MLSSEAEDWPVEISHSRNIETNRLQWTVRYVSGDKKTVYSLTDLQTLIGAENMQPWRMPNG